MFDFSNSVEGKDLDQNSKMGEKLSGTLLYAKIRCSDGQVLDPERMKQVVINCFW